MWLWNPGVPLLGGQSGMVLNLWLPTRPKTSTPLLIRLFLVLTECYLAMSDPFTPPPPQGVTFGKVPAGDTPIDLTEAAISAWKYRTRNLSGLLVQLFHFSPPPQPRCGTQCSEKGSGLQTVVDHSSRRGEALAARPIAVGSCLASSWWSINAWSWIALVGGASPGGGDCLGGRAEWCLGELDEARI